MSTTLLVFTALRVESAAIKRETGWNVVRTGMGVERARTAAARAYAAGGDSPVAIAGLCGGVAPELEAGDIVCASELRRPHHPPVEVVGTPHLAAVLRRHGLRVVEGPILTVDHIVGPDERRTYVDEGILAVDMESGWLVPPTAGRPLGVVRVVLDAAGRRLVDPRTLVAGARSLSSLRRASAALGEWARSVSPPRRTGSIVRGDGRPR